MALEADGILRGRGAYLLRRDGPVDVVAIAAEHQTLVYAVVKGHFELRLLLEVAAIAKLGLGFDEQKLSCLRVVRRMARNAAHIVLSVQGVDGIHVLWAAGVAGQAAITYFLGRVIFE